MTDGHVAGSTWQVADVNRPLMSAAKMVAAESRVHLDSKDPRIVRTKGDVIPFSISGSGKTKDTRRREEGYTGRLESRSLRQRHKTREK